MISSACPCRAAVGRKPLELRFSFFVGSFETPFRCRWARPTEHGFAVEFTGLEPEQQLLLRTALPAD